jgi:undecaprenyldiphospho-muramoylpentapeptide beta-N-acetylglucosaminyltransferase
VVAGGGTVGHVSPGVAIAEALVRRGCPREAIHFVGSKRGVEATRVPSAGFALTLLGGRGIQRRLTPANLAAVAGLASAFVRSLAILLRLRPAVVLSLGGYASAPCALAAALLRIPIVVAEQNAVPGAANRLVGRMAQAAAVSFAGTDLPRAVVTGNPVRPEVLSVDRAVDRATARAALGVEDGRRLVVAYGGSLGARTINRAVWDALPMWVGRGDLAVRHVIGDRGWKEQPPSYPSGALQYQPVRYEERMPLVLAAADVVVSRAGASTVFELAAVGVASVLVPLPIATEDHQTANARALERVGAAVVVPDKDFTAARLVAEVAELLASEDTIAAMGAAARSVGRPDAAERVADLLVRHARRPLPAQEAP